MKNLDSFQLPSDLQTAFDKAKKLEWTTIGYQITVVFVMYITMGSSQAMKTAWLEDALGILPSVAFLIAASKYNKKPTKAFPYGYHRVFNIAFLAGALALFIMGCYMLIDSGMSLLKAEHPTIGLKMIFGHKIWLGWLMIVALIYSSAPAMFLGFKKLPKAKKLHNKILFTDADTQKADYMTAFAAMVGILGVGFGWWWADSAAAVFISFSVIKDGVTNISNAVKDLMDQRPVTVKREKPDPLIDEIREFVRSWNWVEDSEVRFREEGMVYFGEIMVTVRKGTENIDNKIEAGLDDLQRFHWKIYQVNIMPVEKLPE